MATTDWTEGAPEGLASLPSKPDPLPPPGELPMWVVYKGVKDLPFHPYVVRRWVAGAQGSVPDKECTGATTLEEARAAIPPGKVNIGRQPGDDPVIVEVWL